jgi:EmrB/QacA subfamily drug resistance transporter
MFGRRRLFLIGAAIFAVFSAAAAAAPSVEVLLGSRALMAVGGAIMWPAVLGITYAVMAGDRKGLAGGLIIGVAGLGNAIGPLLGGFLTDSASWRWVFIINIPVAAFAAFVTWRYISEQYERGPDDRIDYFGVATLTTSLVALLVALDIAPSTGWGDPVVIALLATFVIAMVAFGIAERHAGRNALVPADVMSNRVFTSSCVAVFLTAGSFFAALVYMPQFFQKILGYTPLEAGAGLLPMMLAFAAISFAAGPLYDRIGGRVVLVTGGILYVAGIAALSLVGASSSFAATIPGMVMLGLAVGLFVSTITTVAVTSLDPSRSSLGGGIVYMFQVGGGSIGLALTTTIFISADRVDKLVPGAAGFNDAFAHGLQTAFRVDALLALAGLAVTVFLLVPRLVRPGAASPS